MRGLAVVCLLLGSFFSTSAHALIITTYTDLGAFQSAAGALVLEDFSGEPNAPLFSKDMGEFTLSLDNSAAPTGAPYGGTFSIFNEQLRLQQCCHWSITKLTFDTSIAALGFDWSNGDTSGDSIELLVDGQSFVFGLPRRQGFFGIIASDGTFNVAGFSDTTGGGGSNSAAVIDNIRYSGAPVSTVHTPETLWLFGLALALLGSSRKIARHA